MIEDHVKKMLFDRSFGHRVSEGGGMVFWTSPAEILAAATNLDGAEKTWWCETHQQSAPPCGARMNCSTVQVLVIPLPDKETPNG